MFYEEAILHGSEQFLLAMLHTDEKKQTNAPLHLSVDIKKKLLLRVL